MKKKEIVSVGNWMCKWHKNQSEKRNPEWCRRRISRPSQTHEALNLVSLLVVYTHRKEYEKWELHEKGRKG